MGLSETVLDIRSENDTDRVDYTSHSGCRKKVKSPKNTLRLNAVYR